MFAFIWYIKQKYFTNCKKSIHSKSYICSISTKIEACLPFFIKFPRIMCCEDLFSSFIAIMQIKETTVEMDWLILAHVLR